MVWREVLQLVGGIFNIFLHLYRWNGDKPGYGIDSVNFTLKILRLSQKDQGDGDRHRDSAWDDYYNYNLITINKYIRRSDELLQPRKNLPCVRTSCFQFVNLYKRKNLILIILVKMRTENWRKLKNCDQSHIIRIYEGLRV